MSAESPEADARRRARSKWQIAKYALGEEPGDDLSGETTPDQRVAMMAELAETAWRVAGRPLPTYARRNLPGRLFRPGEPRPNED